MTTIKKVSTSADPDDYRDSQSSTATAPLPRDEGTYFDARVPARSIDSLRKQVRQRRYSSSTEEAEAIRKTDEELFDKVRVAERHTIARADAMLEHNKGRTGQVLAYLDKIEELRDRLKAGEDTSVVVKEFNSSNATSAPEKSGCCAAWPRKPTPSAPLSLTQSSTPSTCTR